MALTLDDPIPPPSLLIGEQQERRFRHLLDDLADDSVRETAEAVAREIADAATMTAALRIIFEMATARNAGAQAFARLCREMRERISDTVVDAELHDAKGRPVGGPALFTKYLLNVCVERQNLAVTAPPEAADRYVRFLCELFKEPRLITARTMHTCAQLLLRDADTLREEDISRMCALLEDIGQLLDSGKGTAYMDIYFARLRTLSDSHELSGPLRHRITSVLRLREGGWR